jgi:hypothetical protein
MFQPCDAPAPPSRSLPRFDAGSLLPGIMALGVFPLLMALTDDPAASFVTAFFMGLWVVLARHAEMVARYWTRRFPVRIASLLAVAAALIPAASLMALGEPQWCLRLFSLVAGLAILVLLADLREGDQSYLRFRMPMLADCPCRGAMARGLLGWNLLFIAMNETAIQSLDLSGLVVWYAVLPLLWWVAEAALVLTIPRRVRQAH